MTGMEQLLAMAAADGRFAAALLEDRQRAVEASGVALSPSQRRMLDSVDEEGLRGMILGLAGSGTDERRRVFLARAAVALVALAGVSGCRSDKKRPAADEAPTPARQEKTAEIEEQPAEGKAPEKAAPLEGLEGVMGLDNSNLNKAGTGIRPGGNEGIRTLGSGGYGGARADGVHGHLGRRRRAEQVKVEALTVKGGLAKEIVRRINRRHINELRYCYQKERQKKPDLAGAVVLSYTIAPTGRVSSAALGATTTGNAKLDRCVAKAVRRWLYPKARDGKPVQVTARWKFWVEKAEKGKKGKKGKG